MISGSVSGSFSYVLTKCFQQDSNWPLYLHKVVRLNMLHINVLVKFCCLLHMFGPCCRLIYPFCDGNGSLGFSILNNQISCLCSLVGWKVGAQQLIVLKLFEVEVWYSVWNFTCSIDSNVGIQKDCIHGWNCCNNPVLMMSITIYHIQILVTLIGGNRNFWKLLTFGKLCIN